MPADPHQHWSPSLSRRYCHQPFTDDLRPTIDHVIPRSAGGVHALWNLRLACEPCNKAKGSDDFGTRRLVYSTQTP